MMQSSRDPYPFPTFQNDDNFRGPRAEQKQPYCVPTHLAQKQGPFNRLYNTGTLSSIRREYNCHDPQAPNDSLDFILKAQYNHHNELLKGKDETLIQLETLGESNRRLKNRDVVLAEKKPALGHPVKVASVVKKENINSIKGSIEGHHTQTTNRGYSRKPDGGYFTS